MMKKIIYLLCFLGTIVNINAQNIVFSFSVDEVNSTADLMRVDVYARSSAGDETLTSYTTVFWYDDAESAYVSYDEAPAQALGWLTAGNFTVTDATPASVPGGVPNGLTRRIELQQFDGNFAGSSISSTAIKVGTLVFDNSTPGNANVGSDIFISTTAIDAGIAYTDAAFTGHDIVIEGNQSQALPLSLTNFLVEKHSANSSNLNWTTEAEESFSHFELQRSMDGVNFRPFADVQGQGFNAGVNEYSAIDANIPFVGNSEETVFYRLKMIDLDGKYEFSEIRSVMFDERASDVTVFPNPTADFIAVKADSPISNVTIYNIDGRVVLNQKVGGQIDMSSYDSGMYKVIVTSEAGSVTKTVIKLD